METVGHNQLIELLKATLIPEQRCQAETELTAICKKDNFVPILLQFVMSENLDMSVRQAGVVYMKNTILQHWDEKYKPANAFILRPADKQLVRDNIIEAVLGSSNLIRVQLAVCVQAIIRSDYPDKWPSITDKLLAYLQSDNHSSWHGCLVCLHQLVKTFEFKPLNEKQPLNEALRHLFPVIYQIGSRLASDLSEMSAQVQKQILKIFNSHIQYFLPLELLTQTVFTEWMELIRSVADSPLPPECEKVDVSDRASTVWWKCKKWALSIMVRCFDRYGSPGNVQQEYAQFAEWYLQTFTGGLIHVMFKYLDMYRSGQFVSQRVLQLVFNYLTQGVNHSLSWKMIKVHAELIIQDIIFPLLCHSSEDDELWNTDPVEYIRSKYDIYEEFYCPSNTAQSFLNNATLKRRDMLDKTMCFIGNVVVSLAQNPQQKSGALTMLGTVSHTLLKKKKYKDQVESMLVTHVFPDLSSPHGYLRARACSVISSFSKCHFMNVENLSAMLRGLCQMLHSDVDLPVRVEAAFALQALVGDQKQVKEVLCPMVTQIVGDLLTLIRDTENDELTNALQRFVCQFSDDIAPLALDVTKHLADTFLRIMSSPADVDTSDSKSLAIMGILNTMETICTVMEDHLEIMQQLEEVVCCVIFYILSNEMLEFFEEILALIYSLTSQQISARMWLLLPLLHQLVYPGNLDYFVELMPSLHNYVVNGGAKFVEPAVGDAVSSVNVVYEVCRFVLTASSVSEHAECHAAKLLEAIILQFREGPIDHVVPLFIDLALSRLQRPIETSMLRVLLLHVIIAALFYNPPLVIGMLDRPIGASEQTMLTNVVQLWLSSQTELLGLHDRKLFLVGLCTLLSIPSNMRPHVLNVEVNRLLSTAVALFRAVNRVYDSRNSCRVAWPDNEVDVENVEHDDDEDVVDKKKLQFLTQLQKADDAEANVQESAGDEYDADNDEETTLECYETAFDNEDYLDIYQLFTVVLRSIHTVDPAWYQLLTSCLNETDGAELIQILQTAEQRRLQSEAHRLQQQQQQVPSAAASGSVASPSSSSG